MSKSTLILWIVTIVLIAVPMAYFGFNLCDSSFRDSALANWFGTALGVVASVPIAIFLSLYQLKQSQQKEIESRQEQDKLLESMLSRRQHQELIYNQMTVEGLWKVLSSSTEPKVEMWNLASTVADSFEWNARRDWERFIFQKQDRLGDDAPVSLLYDELRRLCRRVKEGKAAHDYFVSFQGGDARSTWQLSEVKKVAENARGTFAQVLSRRDP